jgi:hypothetical protein
LPLATSDEPTNGPLCFFFVSIFKEIEEKIL